MAPMDAATNITKFSTSVIGATLLESPWGQNIAISPRFQPQAGKTAHTSPKALSAIVAEERAALTLISIDQ
jgi:hypothetical protein